MKLCPKCGSNHDKAGLFCSRGCANSRTFSEESKRKRATTYSAWYNSLSEQEKKAFNAKKSTEDSRTNRRKAFEAKFANFAFDDLSRPKKKARILGEQEGKCLFCGLSEWLGQPIKFELDHISGDTTDNNRNNLRVLCPNCHSQTPTFRKGFKTPSPSEEDIVEAYKTSSSMTEILTKLNLKWGSFVSIIKVLEKHGYTLSKN